MTATLCAVTFSNSYVLWHKCCVMLRFVAVPLYVLGKLWEKISLLFLRFSPKFRSSNIFAVTKHYKKNKFFLDKDLKFFFFLKFTLVLLDVFLNDFSKFRFFIVEICIFIWDFWVIFENYSMRMLSIGGVGSLSGIFSPDRDDF